MKASSKLTRLMVFEWLKQNRMVPFVIPFLALASVAYMLNPVIAREPGTALVIRVQNLPSQYSNSFIAFIELPDGRTATVPIPQGTLAPAPGNRINVMHNQHLLLGDSFQWIQ